MVALAKKSDTETSGRSAFSRIFLLAWTASVLIRDAILARSDGHHITATLLLLLQPFWLYRWYKRDTTWPTDLLIVLLLDYWTIGGLDLLGPGFFVWLRETQYQHSTIYGILSLCILGSVAIVIRGDECSTIASPSTREDSLAFLPPLLIPSRTTHSRFFPKKHSFSYSYFYVGIPVGWSGCAASILSADLDLLPLSEQQYGWFHVDAADYLDRGEGWLGLEGKLRNYLRSQVSV